MSKGKKIALAAALSLAILTAFYQTKLARDARDEAQQLRAQQAQSAKEISNLHESLSDESNQVADLIAENSQLRKNPNETELLKLRGEVTRLRPLQEDVVALQKKLQQSSAGLPTWKTNEVANAGRADPINALQTFIYSSQITNTTELQKSIVGDDVDPPSSEALKKFTDTDSNFSIGDNVTAYKILSENWLAPDKVQVVLNASMGSSGLGLSIPLTLRNVNGEWKLVIFNIRDANGNANDVRFFKESL
jgi:hypothetical protein